MKKRRPAKNNRIKNIIIIILATVIVIESIGLAAIGLMKKPSASENAHSGIELNISLEGATGEVTSAVSSLIEGFSENGIRPEDITGLIRKTVYSDLLVNTIMSLSYPLLFQVLTNLEMMDFATNIDLYPTGPLYAQKIQGTPYTCCDKDGIRKPLTEVLNNVGSDWTYMDTVVTWTDSDGVNKTTTLWNTIKWGVTDKESLLNALIETLNNKK